MQEMVIYAGMIKLYWLLLAATHVTGQLHEQYVGCFVDEVNKLKLEHQNNLTIAICIQKCYTETDQTNYSKMTFAALTDGQKCTCRDNFGQEVRDQKCNVKCSGSPVQFCGGNTNSKFYSLYAVCPVGYFGPNCDQLCHCKRQLTCHRTTGICRDGCEEHWTGTSCNNIRPTSNIQKQYIGCYGDGRSAMAMDVMNPGGKTGKSMGNTNSNDFCIEICSNNNYTYAGTQYGYDCNCGEEYDRYGNKTQSGTSVDCNDPLFSCPANRNQKCGGIFANSVYYVCPLGYYGRNCSNRCHCSDGGPCRFNGTCLNSKLNLCKPGWTGSSCNIRDCRINNGDCEPEEKCETVDLGFANLSVCRCKDGSYRDNNTCRSTSLHYVGCYKGSTAHHISVELPTNDTLTIELCIQKCRQLNKTHAIIQAGEACLCGNDIGQILRDSECQVPCSGNKHQYCGGQNMADGTPIYVVYYTAKTFTRQFIGCYKDLNHPAAMDRKFSWMDARNNTVESCARHCASNSYTYAGLQYGYDCFCGNSYERYGPLPESSCNMTCEGNDSQICGGDFANSVYAVNDISILWCSNDTDCKPNEACNVVDLNYMNVSRCRCQQGFERFNLQTPCSDIDECRNASFVCDIEIELCENTIGSYICTCKSGYEKSNYGNCTDVDECHLDRLSSSCDSHSEYCVNSIGSYICPCKEGFVKISGNCEEFNNTPTVTACIILGILLVSSLLINSIFVFFRIKNAKSTKPEQRGDRTHPDFRASSIKALDHQEMIYEDAPAPVGEDNVYEQITMERR